MIEKPFVMNLNTEYLVVSCKYIFKEFANKIAFDLNEEEIKEAIEIYR